jgi:hypothetical protein
MRIQAPGDVGGSPSDSNVYVIPPIGTPALSSIQVKDTGTVKGFCAFATTPLDKGTFLGILRGRCGENKGES